MNDADFIGYVEIHSATERALFNGKQVARMLRLAGHGGDLAQQWEDCGDSYWRSLDMSDMCAEARALSPSLESPQP